MYRGMTVGVAIPALDEEAAVGRVVGDLQGLANDDGSPVVDEIVVCDNGSSDGAPSGRATEFNLSATLRESALALPAGTEMRIYTLSGQPAVPLAEAGGLCKPAGATPSEGLDCDAQPPPRGAAFCARLGDMQRQVAELADASPNLPCRAPIWSRQSKTCGPCSSDIRAPATAASTSSPT